MGNTSCVSVTLLRAVRAKREQTPSLSPPTFVRLRARRRPPPDFCRRPPRRQPAARGPTARRTRSEVAPIMLEHVDAEQKDKLAALLRQLAPHSQAIVIVRSSDSATRLRSVDSREIAKDGVLPLEKPVPEHSNREEGVFIRRDEHARASYGAGICTQSLGRHSSECVPGVYIRSRREQVLRCTTRTVGFTFLLRKL